MFGRLLGASDAYPRIMRGAFVAANRVDTAIQGGIRGPRLRMYRHARPSGLSILPLPNAPCVRSPAVGVFLSPPPGTHLFRNAGAVATPILEGVRVTSGRGSGTKPFQLGILTSGRVLLFITSLSLMMPFL